MTDDDRDRRAESLAVRAAALAALAVFLVTVSVVELVGGDTGPGIVYMALGVIVAMASNATDRRASRIYFDDDKEA